MDRSLSSGVPTVFLPGRAENPGRLRAREDWVSTGFAATQFSYVDAESCLTDPEGKPENEVCVGILEEDRNDEDPTNLQTFSGSYLMTYFDIERKRKASIYQKCRSGLTGQRLIPRIPWCSSADGGNNKGGGG